jgi:homoprotocatechuate degradation regulator HpaR
MADSVEASLRSYEKSLPIALLRAREATMRRFKPHLDGYGMTVQQWRIIRALADHGPLDASRLSERCVILPPSLTRIFKTLTAKGLIEPIADPDGRRHTVALTASGRELYETMAPTSEAIYKDLEAAFGPGDMEQLLDLLTRLRDVAHSLPETIPAPNDD